MDAPPTTLIHTDRIHDFASTIWNIPDGVATLIAGFAAILGGFLAWQGIQAQIKAQQLSEARKALSEKNELRQAITAEVIAFSPALFRSASIWNRRSNENPSRPVSSYPVFPDPVVYKAVVAQLGKLGADWPALSVITFYGNLLDLNDMSRESAAGRPTSDQTAGTVAERMSFMCSNAAEAISGLNGEREFPIPPESPWKDYIAPDGRRIGDHDVPLPRTLQGLLFRLAGRSHPSDTPSSTE